VELKDLYPEENFTNNLFDKIALIIYDPVHKLPSRLKAHCSSINLAPTVMHLLSIDSISSHFQGHSIFDNPTDSTFLSIYSGAVYEKRINEKTFIDRRTNYLISNWLKYNQQLFRNNKLIPTKSQY
jgi:hypothetical protein